MTNTRLGKLAAASASGLFLLALSSPAFAPVIEFVIDKAPQTTCWYDECTYKVVDGLHCPNGAVEDYWGKYYIIPDVGLGPMSEEEERKRAEERIKQEEERIRESQRQFVKYVAKRSGGGAKFYEHASLGGRHFSLESGYMNTDLHRKDRGHWWEGKHWDDVISSIDIGPCSVVTLYESELCKGECGSVKVITNDSNGYSGVNLSSEWNDRARCVIVSPYLTDTGDCSYTGYLNAFLESLPKPEKPVDVVEVEKGVIEETPAQPVVVSGLGLSCELRISGVLDDHYKSGGQYGLQVSVGTKTSNWATAPFEHGQPFGKVFDNWKTESIQLGSGFSSGDVLDVKFTHTGSPKGDWIGIDYLELVCGGETSKNDLRDYGNYGKSDGAAGIVYGGQTKTWQVKVP